MAPPDTDRPEEESEKPETDWLVRLRRDSSAKEDKPSEEKDSAAEHQASLIEDDGESWTPPPTAMLDLPTDPKEHADAESPPPPPEAGDVPDWLVNVAGREWRPGTTTVFSVPSEPTEKHTSELPDWLQPSLAEVQSSAIPAEPTEEEGDVPDWLKTIQSEQSTDKPDRPAPVLPKSSDLPGWLSEEKPGEPEIGAAPITTGGLPSWLTSAEAEPAESAPIGSRDLPDWLFGTDESGDSEAAPESSEPEAASDITDAEPAPSEPEEDGIPDWLSTTEGTEAKDVPIGTSDLPSWLQASEQQPVAETPPAEIIEEPSIEASASDDVPDWLSVAEGTEARDVPISTSDLPSWLQASEQQPVAAAEPEEGTDKPEAEIPASEGEDQVPDWLATTEGTEAKDVSIGTSDLPSLLQAPEQQLEAAAEPEVSVGPEDLPTTSDVETEDQPDWPAESEPLTSFAPSKPDPSVLEPDPIPDWLAEGEPTPQESAETEPEAELPAWMSESAPLAADVEETLSPDSEPTAETPDRLATPEAESELLEIVPTEEPEAAADKPAWLVETEAALAADTERGNFQTARLEPPTGLSDLAVPPEGEDDDQESTIEFQLPDSANLPDWLEPTSSRPPAETEDESSQPEHVSDVDFSDFLVEPEAAAIDFEAPVADLPDWLAGIRIQDVAAQSDAPAISSDAPGDADDDTLDWLAILDTVPQSRRLDEAPAGAGDENGEHPAVIGAPETEGPDLTPPTGDDLPDWLAAVGPPSEVTQTTDSEITGELPQAADMPDWLAAMRPEGIEEPVLPQDPRSAAIPARGRLPKEPEIEAAELPEWAEELEATDEVSQPVSLASTADDYEEKAGPLAGMSGIIRAEPVVTLAGTPGVSVTNFTVTDWQREQAEIFRELMREEIEDLPEETRRKFRLPFAVDRLIVYALILLAMLTPFALGETFFDTPKPELFPQNRALFESIASLPADSLVLVAFEYEPGTGGELNDALEGVLYQLADRGHRIALVSTRPAGVGIAQALIERTLELAEIDAAATYGSKYVNLGFIPGGAIGLQAFAGDPIGVIDVDFIRGESPWEMAVVADVNTLQSFDLILVAADTPTASRAWLEQVRTSEIPMGAIVTASAEPLVLPYAEGEEAQLVGLSAGLTGAFINDIIAPHGVSPVSRRWDSFSAGILVAGLILLAGNVLWVAIGLARQQTRIGSDL